MRCDDTFAPVIDIVKGPQPHWLFCQAYHHLDLIFMHRMFNLLHYAEFTRALH